MVRIIWGGVCFVRHVFEDSKHWLWCTLRVHPPGFRGYPYDPRTFCQMTEVASDNHKDCPMQKMLCILRVGVAQLAI